MNEHEDSSGRLAGLRVAAFESRRAEAMARLIERLGGTPFVTPALREVPLAHSASAVDFAHRLITGQVGLVIFLTGAGFDYLLQLVQQHVDRQRYLHALADGTTLARGPKVVAAMKRVGLEPTLRTAEPHTWRELLTTIDEHLVIDHQTVGLQAHGQASPSLTAGLEARGAQVLHVDVYRWELPEDTGPLEQNVRRLADGQLDVVLFTAVAQVNHVLRVARQLEIERRVRDALERVVVGSIGAVTSQALRDQGLPVDLEPESSRWPQLLELVASRGEALRQRKRAVRTVLAEPAPTAGSAPAAWQDSPFMKACRGEPTAVTPIWLMRQAGRYMAEYRSVRSRVSFLELCKDPALCSEVMCTAVARLGVDAAIVFSDLLPILEPMGFDLEFVQGEGPVVHNPVRETRDMDRVRELEHVESLHFVMEAVRQTRRDLPSHIPLIGFAGAPFTLASYTIEGGASRSYLHTKTLMYRDPGAWDQLMGRFARAVARYANAQVAAGAQCIQLFDSWVGCLGPRDYRRFVLPGIRQLAESIATDVPLILFTTGNPALLPLVSSIRRAVVGVDWRVRLADAWTTIGTERVIQGNLDPCVLLADRSTIRAEAAAILEMAAGRPGHIFNLGHGVLPQTPVDHAVSLVDAVHELSSR